MVDMTWNQLLFSMKFDNNDDNNNNLYSAVDTNSILTVLCIVIQYIQMQYVHIWTYIIDCKCIVVVLFLCFLD